MPKVIVSTRPPCERRFRAGLAFGPDANEVEVSEEQLAAIKADTLLQLHKPSKTEKTDTPPPAKDAKGEGK